MPEVANRAARKARKPEPFVHLIDASGQRINKSLRVWTKSPAIILLTVLYLLKRKAMEPRRNKNTGDITVAHCTIQRYVVSSQS
jgi:hypothetical protein